MFCTKFVHFVIEQNKRNRNTLRRKQLQIRTMHHFLYDR